MAKFRWLIILLAQLLSMLLLGSLVSGSLWLNHALYQGCMWAVMPLLGGVSAYWATRKGLLNYLAWISPPLGQTLGHLCVWFYLPGAGPVLLCAFISLVGAAAGQVRLQEQQKKHSPRS